MTSAWGSGYLEHTMKKFFCCCCNNGFSWQFEKNEDFDSQFGALASRAVYTVRRIKPVAGKSK